MTHVLDAEGRIKEYWGEVALVDLADYAQGSLIYGGAADWQALVHPGTAYHLQTNAADVLWTQNITMADGAWQGIGAALERIVFDAAGYVSVMGAKLGIETLTPSTDLVLGGDRIISTVGGNMLGVQTAAANTGTYFYVIPNGAPGAGTFDFALFSTDFIADNVNWEGIFIQKTIGGAGGINVAKGGTGTYHDLQFWTSGVLQWTIDTAGTLIGAAGKDVTINAGFLELSEMAAPGAGAANTGRLYLVDNAGKTELYVIFATGVSQLIASEP